MVRFGIIGLGNMGREHVRWLPTVPGAELTAVCDIVPEKLAPYTEFQQFESSADLIRSGLVDAVLIATPHYSHTTIGIDALENGLHVLTEKPISVHKADCEKLISAFRSCPNKPVFGAMFNQRTGPNYQEIRRIAQSGDLGPIQRVSWIITDWFRTETYYASGGWRATWAGEGGGVLLNQCPHNLDLLQWICGMPNRVRAFCTFGKYHDIEVEDEVTAYLEWSNGATGVFIATTGEAPGTNRLEIAGDMGKLTYENGRITVLQTESPVSQVNATSPNPFAVVPTTSRAIESLGSGPQHVGIIENFVRALEQGEPLIAPAEEGIHSVELANAMILSSITGQTVELPLDSQIYAKQLASLVDGSTYQKAHVRELVPDMTGSFGSV